MNLEIRSQPLGGSRLAQAYLAGDPDVRALFARDPFSLASFRAQWADVRGRFFKSDRARIAAQFRTRSERAARRLGHFVEHGGAVVTTGQQAGLFTGPLYTLHKALTAIRLAEALEASLGITVLPVFWVASDDHDWAEVNHVHVVGGAGEVRRIEVPSTDDRPLSMDQRRFESSLESACAEMEHLIAGQPFARDSIELFREAYRPGTSVAAAFGEMVLELFGPLGMMVVDAADPGLKKASVPLLRRELLASTAHEAALAARAREIEARGYPPQVSILPGGSNLFFRTKLGRERLFRDARGWIARESGERFTEAELEKAIAAQPTRFSPNVLLRPVVESAAFPVLAYVAGPGEIGYFGQIQPLFQAHGVPMPVVYPRAALQLVEGRVRQEMDALGVNADDLQLPRHELIRRHSEARLPADVRAALESLRGGLVAGFDRVADAVAGVDPTLRGAAGARRNRALLLARELETKALRAVARNERGWVDRVDAVRSHLYPLGAPQERVLNALPFLAAHGRGILPAMAARIPVRWNEPSA